MQQYGSAHLPPSNIISSCSSTPPAAPRTPFKPLHTSLHAKLWLIQAGLTWLPEASLASAYWTSEASMSTKAATPAGCWSSCK